MGPEAEEPLPQINGFCSGSESPSNTSSMPAPRFAEDWYFRFVFVVVVDRERLSVMNDSPALTPWPAVETEARVVAATSAELNESIVSAADA
jgi:hypothetical protein